MDEQLTLEQLAIYLPYGLLIRDTIHECTWVLHPYKDAVDNLSNNENISLESLMCENEAHNSVLATPIKQVHKPILRPLSDLTKEIEVSGEKFVPVLEIGKMCGYDNLEKYEVDGDWEYGWTQRDYDDGQGFSFGWWPEGKCFGVWYDYIDSEDQPIYQLGGFDLIQKLASWHFDIHGLIGKGLAIDINTLKR